MNKGRGFRKSGQPDKSSLSSSGTLRQTTSRPISQTGISHISQGDDQEDEAPEHSGCAWSLIRRLQHIDATNLRINPVDPGNWDEWGVYYCSSRFGRHGHFNSNYFALVSLICLAQSNFFHLIYLMRENGGAAFLIVLLMTYMFFGYPAYLMETIMGQISGRKPPQMLRLLLPLFSGLGVALYLRTMYRSINAFGKFSICLYHSWDLLFCKGAASVFVKRMIIQERDNPKFMLWRETTHSLIYLSGEEDDFDFMKFVFFLLSFGVGLCFTRIKKFGAGMVVVVRLLLLMLVGYTANAYVRTHPPSSDYFKLKTKHNDLIFTPFYLVFEPKWIHIFHGTAWVKATLFVMNSMELGTLVHTYFGSQLFFHYRSPRDGIYLILLVITWHIIGVAGVLLWMGYVTIDANEMEASLKSFNGLHGMLVVFMVKHLQAEMTQKVESDVLLFCSIFYFIIGITAFLATIVYIYILVECIYAESGHPTLKLCYLVAYVLYFVVVLFPRIYDIDGFRHLMYFNFYGGFSWSGLFLIMCYSIAVASSHGVGRLLYDFYNVVHLKGYEVRTHYYAIPKLVVFLFTMLPLISMLREAIERTIPNEGSTDWSDPLGLVIGHIILLAPILCIILGILLYLYWERKDKSKPIFKPHRDFYKNKHHISVCFKDYLFFDTSRIPAQGRRRSRRPD